MKQFSRDVVWNVASLAVAGACGIALNYLIGLVYDEAALGVFNQVFAAYLLFSQVAALGVHYSVLQRVAAATSDGERADETTSALAVTLGVGAVAALAFAAAAPLVGRLLSSDDVARGMRWAAPGVLFFALSKVCLACLNGVRRMRGYAVLYGGRFVLLLAAFGGCVALDAPSSTLPVVLSIAEMVTLALAMVALGELRRGRVSRTRAREHLAFGVRGFMSGVLAELNTRVDVLMLGYFASDDVVGVFSFAAILAEGAFQVLVALRTNYAPLCTQLLARGEHDELRAMIRRGRNRTYAVAIPLAAVTVLAYWGLGQLLSSHPVIADSWPYFAVLLAGMAAASGFVPFSTLLLYARRPGAYTWMTLGVVLVNVVANVILIPAIGSIGAAIGTSIAFVALAVISARIVVWAGTSRSS